MCLLTKEQNFRFLLFEHNKNKRNAVIEVFENYLHKQLFKFLTIKWGILFVLNDLCTQMQNSHNMRGKHSISNVKIISIHPQLHNPVKLSKITNIKLDT